MNNVKGIVILEEKYLIRNILYLNTDKVTRMTQVLNKKLYAKMSNQMSHKIMIITCDKDIFNIKQNINAYGQGFVY